MTKGWVHKHCLECETPFKPRGPKKYCSRMCKIINFNREHISLVKEIVNKIKLERGCESGECQWVGEFEPEMLDFDHIDPSVKEGNIATIKSRKIESILLEISKCRVLCANCHRTHTKRNWNAYQ